MCSWISHTKCIAEYSQHGVSGVPFNLLRTHAREQVSRRSEPRACTTAMRYK
ncbi:hypothetical protein C8T65DRAFT_77470 [Cerioporus squamosus]|nr:hypothetical protein C8T65DRAFT_77470 [Cerioporus squamosus]